MRQTPRRALAIAMSHVVAACFWLSTPHTLAADAASEKARGDQAFDGAANPSSQYTARRRIRYTFTLHNDSAYPLEHGRLSVYAPVHETATQRVDAVTTSHPAQTLTDAGGNQLLEFALDTFPPFGSRVVSVEVELSLTDTPNAGPISAVWLSSFTASERFVESKDEQILKLARTLKGDNVLLTARNIHDWIHQHLRALSYAPEDRGALDALTRHAGDCTEQAYLFTALARANAIPTRMLAGFVMRESGVLDPHDYHNWAEFYVDGAWQIADPYRGVFARKASQYVAMRVISSMLPSQQSAGQRFSVAGSGLRVTSN